MSVANFSGAFDTIPSSYVVVEREKALESGREVVFSEQDIYRAVSELPNFANSSASVNKIPVWKKKLNEAFSIMMPITLVLLMFGMGCHVNWREVLGNFWPPLGIIIGLCGQFVILPSLAFGVTRLFGMEPYVALGCLIVSCSPGGAFSNFFTYWAQGDVALSLVMTTCSTLLAFGGMPLNLYIYSHHIIGPDSERIGVPYKSILQGLGFVCVPVISGMVIRHFSEKIGDLLTKIASRTGLLLVAVNIATMLILFWQSIIGGGWKMHLAAFLLPLVGTTLAYLVAFLFRRPSKVCRAIALETASQNIPVAIGIISFSFPEFEIRDKMILYPTLYAIYNLLEAIAMIGIFVYFFKKKTKTVDDKPEKEAQEQANTNV